MKCTKLPVVCFPWSDQRLGTTFAKELKLVAQTSLMLQSAHGQSTSTRDCLFGCYWLKVFKSQKLHVECRMCFCLKTCSSSPAECLGAKHMLHAKRQHIAAWRSRCHEKKRAGVRRIRFNILRWKPRETMWNIALFNNSNSIKGVMTNKSRTYP